MSSVSLRSICIGLVTGIVLTACDHKKPATVPLTEGSNHTDTTVKDILDFPAELRLDDEQINGFVEKAMNACASGDYDQFRRLWSVREEPLSREEFSQGWEAVQEIRIQALKKVRIDRGPGNDNRPAADTQEIRYVVLAEVRFDPKLKAAIKEDSRVVVLMLIREQGEWRVTRAPKPIRDWIQQQVSTKSATGEP